MTKAELTKYVKDTARLHGAVLVGIAPIERFDPMPPFYDKPPEYGHPKFYVPDAKSVISFAMPILNPVVDGPANAADLDMEFIPPDIKHQWLDVFYDRVGHKVHDDMLEFIGQIVGQNLVMQGYEAMFFPTTGISVPVPPGKKYFDLWSGKGKYSKFGYHHGPFSHRHAATRAGLGEFCLSNIVLTPEFGPRVRFNTVVTNAELEPDPLITEPICKRGKCGFICMKACHMDVISLRDDAEVRDYRSVDFKIDMENIFIDTPSKSLPQRCMDRRNKCPNAPVRGDCMRGCPAGKGRRILHEGLRKLIREEAGQPLRKYKFDFKGEQ